VSTCPSAAHRFTHANLPEPIATFYQLPSSAGGLVEAKREALRILLEPAQHRDDDLGAQMSHLPHFLGV
jgi:hypothetical protein